MGYINVYVSSDAHISVQNNSLYLKSNNNEVQYPLEDINCVMIENLKTQITTFTLNAFAEHGILTFICNNNHLPSGLVLPFCEHYKTLSVFNYQKEISKPLKKQLWKSIVVNKITNQNEVLNVCGLINKLKTNYENVLSGDSTNEEAKASLIYFKYLFGSNFARRDSTPNNAFLDYGYSIVRSFIARSIVMHGLTPFMGLYHCNQYNAFNLADDLIEPFRPIVDLFVKMYLTDEKELTTSIKSKLLNLINYDVLVDNKKQTISNAIDIYVESYIKCLKEKANVLKTIEICGLSLHNYE